MICSYCNYNSETNSSEEDYEFWELVEVNFEFQRREFTDEVEIMNSSMFLCPKCFKPNFIIKDKRKLDVDNSPV